MIDPVPCTDCQGRDLEVVQSRAWWLVGHVVWYVVCHRCGRSAPAEDTAEEAIKTWNMDA